MYMLYMYGKSIILYPLKKNTIISLYTYYWKMRFTTEFCIHGHFEIFNLDRLEYYF